MQTVLFHETIFGPIHSRRLGVSLGVNLMPNDGKICSFDCVYCEAGLNAQGAGKSGIPSRESVKKALNRKLKAMTEAGENLDVITFSGNGEPTLHPQFKEIVMDVIMLRDRFFPMAKVSVLSNSPPHTSQQRPLHRRNRTPYHRCLHRFRASAARAPRRSDPECTSHRRSRARHP